MESHNARYVLISHPDSLFYLTGFQGLSPQDREAFAVVTPSQVFLIIPEMYREQAFVLKQKMTVVVDTERDGLLSLALQQCSQKGILLIEENNISASEYSFIQKPFLLSFNSVMEYLIRYG